jgi:phenylpropionate dioxygenase-like ring-hydroxylating dioxygenase large terminal subunit
MLSCRSVPLLLLLARLRAVVEGFQSVRYAPQCRRGWVTTRSSPSFFDDTLDDEDFQLSWNDDTTLEDEVASSSMGAWVPVGSVSCLKGLDPTEIECMGLKFAVWRSGTTWSVVNNECPHRMAPLSLGRVDPATNCIECPYHGWQFDCDGKLQSIPQLEAGQELRSGERSVVSYPTHLTGDLLWMFLPTSIHGESFPRTLLPEDYYHDLHNFMGNDTTYYTNDLPFSYDFLVEK